MKSLRKSPDLRSKEGKGLSVLERGSRAMGRHVGTAPCEGRGQQVGLAAREGSVKK